MRDFQIRSFLHTDYLSNYHEDSQSIVVDELPICAGKTVADMAVVNGCLHAYEIKGSFDSLTRLAGQMGNYQRVFDFVTIVTTQNHLKGVIQKAPPTCGIILLEMEGKEIRPTKIRQAEKNHNVDSFSIAQLLWRDEAVQVLEKHGMAKGLKNKRKWLLWEALSKLPIEIISNDVREILKNRVNWKESNFVINLDTSTLSSNASDVMV